MKHIQYIIIAMIFCGCTTTAEERKKQEKGFLITCELPGTREVKKYRVNHNEMKWPANHRGGIWSFKTLDGKLVRSTYCHVESE